MNARTKLHRQWHRELYQFFHDNGIEYCEYPGCNSTFGIAGAHRMKRRFINDRCEYMMAALLCTQCHHHAEYGTKDEPGTHERMHTIITDIINAR